jgi:hypothetical protein
LGTQASKRATPTSAPALVEGGLPQAVENTARAKQWDRIKVETRLACMIIS